VGSLLLEIARMAALPDAYISRADIARQLNRNERTLERWTSHGTGPAITRIGKSPHYRKDIVHAWLLAQVKPHVRQGGRQTGRKWNFRGRLSSRRRSMVILNNIYNEN
jgi:hypothetical protein